MSANRIYLVCAHHADQENSLLLAERADNDVPYLAARHNGAVMNRTDHWFSKHMVCGRGCDHFKIAYGRPQDWDVPKPAELTAAGGVRLALVNSHAD